MSIETRFRCDPLTPEQFEILFKWGDDVFGAAAYDLKWQAKTYHLLLYDDERLLCHVGLLQHPVTVAGQTRQVGGVGGVITVPGAQGRGLASRLMKEAHDKLAEQALDAGMLFCREAVVPFYASLGWQTLPPPVTVRQGDTVIEMPVIAMIKPLGARRWPEGSVDVPGLPW